MDVSELDQAVQHYLGNCVAPATRAAYRSGQRRYANFCARAGISTPYPVSEETLCHFVAFLGRDGLKHRTIKSYLSAIRFAQIHQALGNPFKQDTMPLLEYVLTGTEARAATRPDPCLPITIQVLRCLKGIWIVPNPHPDSTMLWAAASTGFFGFLRASEFTVPAPLQYDPSAHLSLRDLAVDSHSAPSVV